jgi:hypothetical protein
MGLTFWVNNTNFGAMNNNQTMNTTTGTPPPFVCANTGNVPLNVTLKALNPLFTSSGLGNSSFQYKARENQTGAFNTTVSQMNWANVTAGYTTLFGYLTYSNNLNNAYVDILLTVPVAEGAGAKSSNLSLQGLYG